MPLMTRLERRMAAEALSQLLAGASNLTKAQYEAAESAHAKLLARRDPAQTLRDCLSVAFTAFSHNDDGPVWADSLIDKTRRILRATK